MLSQITVTGTPARESSQLVSLTLAHRTRLIGEDALDLTLLGGSVHHAERRAENTVARLPALPSA